MGVSIKDIATDTGLSIVTVSKYLNGKSISSHSMELIEDSIRRLHYVPNINARIIRDTKTNIIAVVSSGYNSIFLCDIISDITTELSEKGYVPMLIVYDYTQDPIEKIKNYLRINFAGVIIIPKNNDDDTAHFFIEKKIPLVIIDLNLHNIKTDVVTSANYDAGYMMASYLISKGHEYIGCICADLSTDTLYSRYSGFKTCLIDNGVYHGENYFCSGDFTYSAGKMNTMTLMSRNPKPTALASLCDDNSLGIIMKLSEMGYKIGKDISYIAIDDNEIYSSLNPPVTVIDQDKEKLAQMAVLTLISKILNNNIESDGMSIYIPTIMIERGSVVNLAQTRKNNG